MEDPEKPGIWLVIGQWSRFKDFDKFLNSEIFNGLSFIIRISRFLDFALFEGLGVAGKVVIVRHPQAVTEIIKSAYARSVIRMESADDRSQWICLKFLAP